ncbi:MAG: hypothetical protein WCF90_09575 [Methanomicrobiales archaeon]
MSYFWIPPDPASNTTTGDSLELLTISRAIAAEKPEFALYIGDLINVWGLTNASPCQEFIPASSVTEWPTLRPTMIIPAVPV